MTDALINDKPQFVRLFTENGLNILDYLTYNRLESLYRSVADGTLVYHLLQRRLAERLGASVLPANQDSASKMAAGHTQGGPGKEITLFEVSRDDVQREDAAQTSEPYGFSSGLLPLSTIKANLLFIIYSE